MKPIRIDFQIEKEDVLTACALLVAKGRTPAKRDVLTWLRARYTMHGYTDINEDMLREAQIDDYDEELWAKANEAAERIMRTNRRT